MQHRKSEGCKAKEFNPRNSRYTYALASTDMDMMKTLIV